MTSEVGVLVTGLAAIASFAVAFHFSGLIARVCETATEILKAVVVLADKTLDDVAKERFTRRTALRLFGQSFLIALSAFFVPVAPAVIMWVGDLTGLAPFASVTDFLLSWEVLVGATGVAFILWIIRR